jgi:lipopolysaccharide/colanic/teichoic acid biosynthesis glycosyltransferase
MTWLWIRFGKRSLDILGSTSLLLLYSPLIAAAMALTKLSSRGPAFYSQERVGLGGACFRIYKIRTMVHDSEHETGAIWSTPGDPRVTRVGRILRCTHLDELPQLWNILRGEMSLVGPRPERPEFVSQLRLAIPRYPERLGVLPGLTGLAQVHLPPDLDLTSVRRKLAFDLYYIERMGPWLDLQLILCTALFLSGIGFPASRRLLRIPPASAIEGAHGESVAEPESTPRMQPA